MDACEPPSSVQPSGYATVSPLIAVSASSDDDELILSPRNCALADRRRHISATGHYTSASMRELQREMIRVRRRKTVSLADDGE